MLVVAATFPVVLPFLMTNDAGLAMQASRVITLVMLFAAGLALGRHAGHAHPARTGLSMLLARRRADRGGEGAGRMTVPVRLCTVLAMLAGVAAADANATEAAADAGLKVSGSVTGMYYAMRDQPDFGVGVASMNIGALRFEGRYNYEVRDAGSLFVGWKFSGGDVVTFEITPIVGGLVGAAHGVVPGVEASVGLWLP